MAPQKGKKIIASVRDSLGRTIVLEEGRWEHILKHEPLDGYEMAVMRTAEDADRRHKGNYPGSEVLYGERGPARWLAVVVEYDGLRGRVITAYPIKEPKKDR